MALSTGGGGGAMPMMTVTASMPVMTLPTPNMGGGGGGGATPSNDFAPPMPSGTDALFAADAYGPDDIAIGIEIGAEWVRASVWDAERQKPVALALGDVNDDDTEPQPLRSVVTFVRPQTTSIGEAALSAGTPQNRLVGVKRLLGRRYDEANGAFLDAAESGAGLLACPLAAAEEGGVRLCLSHERVNSQLRKRGEAPRVVSGGADKDKDKDKERSATIDKRLAPEEVLYRLLARVKERAQIALDAEATHALLTVPAHYGLAQRQATADAATLAGFSVLGVVSGPVALCALPKLKPPPQVAAAAAAATTAAAAPAPVRLLLDWGASSCSCGVMRYEEGAWRLVASGGDDALGGLAIDRAVATELAATLAPSMAAQPPWTPNPDQPANKLALLAAARELKHALSGGGGGGGGDGDGGEGGEASCDVHLRGAAAEAEAEAAVEARTLRLSRAEWEKWVVAAARRRCDAMLRAVAAQAALPAAAAVSVHVGGGCLRSAALRRVVDELTAAHFGGRKAANGGKAAEGGGEGATKGGAAAAAAAAALLAQDGAHGAAVLAAHALQPAAVGLALGGDAETMWMPPLDALPFAVAVRVEGANGGGKVFETVFERLASPPLSVELPLDALAEPSTVTLVELPHHHTGGAAGEAGAAGGAAVVLRVSLDATPKRALDKMRRETAPDKPTRRLHVSVAASGLLDAEADDLDDDAGSGRGCGSQLLVVMMLLAGVAGFAGTLLGQKVA